MRVFTELSDSDDDENEQSGEGGGGEEQSSSASGNGGGGGGGGGGGDSMGTLASLLLSVVIIAVGIAIAPQFIPGIRLGFSARWRYLIQLDYHLWLCIAELSIGNMRGRRKDGDVLPLPRMAGCVPHESIGQLKMRSWYSFSQAARAALSADSPVLRSTLRLRQQCHRGGLDVDLLANVCSARGR
jgi:hypothetical protein